MPSFLEYYEELYYKEIEFCDRLNGKIGNSLTVLTLIGSGHVLLATNIFPFYLKSHIFSILFIIAYAISIVLFIVSVIRFVKAYSGFKYEYYPIEAMGKVIDESTEIGVRSNSISSAEAHLEKTITNRYRLSAIANRKTNLVKIQMQFEFTNALMRSSISILISFAIWVVFLKEGGVIHG